MIAADDLIRTSDKQILDFFLKWNPNFAEDKVVDIAPQGSTGKIDIICTLANNDRIGVELTEWLVEPQRNLSKFWDKLIYEALSEIGGFIWPKILSEDVRKDKELIPAEIQKLVHHVANQRKTVQYFDSNEINSLSPILGKYWVGAMVYLSSVQQIY